MSETLVPVIYGSVRTGRLGIRVARFIVAQLKAKGITAVLVDAKEKQLPVIDRMYKEFPSGQAPAVLQDLATLYRSADGFLIVCGEYNHGLQPGLSNLLDYFLEEYYWRPAAIVSYSDGIWGGVRAAVQLREVLAEMGMVSIPSTLPIPRAGGALSEAGEPLDPQWSARAGKFIDEFLWYIEALKERRKSGVPY